MSHHPPSDGPLAAIRSPADDIASISDRQLIVASNRQPYRHDYDDVDRVTVHRPTGGLTAGLDPVMQRTGGTWIAWGDGDGDPDVVDTNGCVSVPPEDPSYSLRRVWLSEEQVRDYYYGFSNQVLWPVCHSALTRVRCDAPYWRRYREVNERFADAVVDHADDRPLVWLQDYHLALAPAMARSRLPDDAVVMHFWHIPWPSWDVFRACPHGRELLEGLLGNDLIGFHVPRYRTNFLRCVDAALDGATVDWPAGRISYRGRDTAVEGIPMGVPVDRIGRSAAEMAGDGSRTAFEREQDIDPDRRLAIGVDRLDYTKGIVECLRALERLWETRPRWRGELTYVQNASESRSRIPAYQEVQERVEGEVDRINRRFGTDDWQPIVYTTERISRQELYQLYRRADAALVTPIRDGMNLVAQEYVAAQTDGSGVLVLSDQAGVHDELGEHAVSVTPHDTERLVEGIVEALVMSPGERRRRMDRLRRWVAEHDLDSWLDENFRAAMAVPATDTGSAPRV